MGMEDVSTRLCKQVARQAEDLSTLEASRIGAYLFVFSWCCFFPQPISEFVALPPELGEKVKALEQDLETSKASSSQNAEEQAKSREERRALEGDLDQIHDVA